MSCNTPPEDALWLEDIEEQLVSLVRTTEQRWQRIAALLIEVKPKQPVIVPAGKIVLEVWAVCMGEAKSAPGPMSQKRF